MIYKIVNDPRPNMHKVLDLHMNIKTQGQYSWTFRARANYCMDC